MNSRDFCFWLQGFFEINGSNSGPVDSVLTASQIQVIKNHLNLVFIHDIDQTMPDATGKLQEVHDGKSEVQSVAAYPQPAQHQAHPVRPHFLHDRPPGARC